MSATLKRFVPVFRRGSVAFEALVVATTAAITATATYKIASKRLDAEFATRLDAEIEATRKFYSALNEKPNLDDIVAAVPELQQELIVEPVEEASPAVKDPRPDIGLRGEGVLVQYNKMAGNYDGGADHTPGELEETVVPDVVTRNVFETGESTETLPPEIVDARSSDVPYLITFEEYSEGENSQETLTYYADDAVLADDQEEVVDDILGMVGPDALNSFGVGSGDSRTVFVRNEAIDVDYEIIYSPGNYGETVHGIAPVVGRRSTEEE